MTDPKSKTIPLWQRQKQEVSDTPKVSSNDQRDLTDKTKNPELQSRAILLEQATKFLENDDIRNSSTDRKTEFLESKGLTNEEIHNLLGVSRNEDILSSPAPAQEVENFYLIAIIG